MLMADNKKPPSLANSKEENFLRIWWKKVFNLIRAEEKNQKII